MAPVVHGLETQYFGEIGFVFLDIEDEQNAALMRQFGFRYQPMFVIIYGNGETLKTWAGSVSASDFEAEFAKAMSN